MSSLQPRRLKATNRGGGGEKPQHHPVLQVGSTFSSSSSKRRPVPGFCCGAGGCRGSPAGGLRSGLPAQARRLPPCTHVSVPSRSLAGARPGSGPSFSPAVGVSLAGFRGPPPQPACLDARSRLRARAPAWGETFLLLSRAAFEASFHLIGLNFIFFNLKICLYRVVGERTQPLKLVFLTQHFPLITPHYFPEAHGSVEHLEVKRCSLCSSGANLH